MRATLSFFVRCGVATLGALLGHVASATDAGDDAEACGGFVGGPIVPAIAVEQVLLAYDDAHKMEHFVREVRFEGAREPFGFIVPTPGQPEVAKVEHPPFEVLTREFPFVKYEQEARLAHQRAPGRFDTGLIGTGQGFGSGHGRGSGVVVLSQLQIGKFKAFVLRASEKDGLASWLRDNGFKAPESTRPWLDHYVALGFYFTAFRYDGGKDEGMQSETVRLSFATPLPYYPYLEPKHGPGEQAKRDVRELKVWFVARTAAHPVALDEDTTGQLQWKQPWSEGMRTIAGHADVAKQAGEELAPLLPDAPTLVVQAFDDRKISRQGFGDVVLAPDDAAPIAPDARASLEGLSRALLPEGTP